MPVPAICLLKSMIYTRCSQAIGWHSVDVYGLIYRPRVARATIVPALPEFMAAHPDLELEVSMDGSAGRSGSRGVRWRIAVGPIRDETLIAPPLGLLRMVNAASPAYLARHGVPRSLDDLRRQEHRTIYFSTLLGARPIGWEYPDGDSYATLQLPGALHVNSAQTYEAAALAGLGLI